MKNILFLLSILLGQPMLCQAQRLGGFLGNLVAPLDKTEISSGFLWDKGLNGFAEPALFDGILRDSICLQPATFGFLYAQARNAFVGTGVNPLPHPDVYMNFVKRHTGTDTVPLVALVLRYHRIHKDAVDSNLLSLQNEQLFDVPGRTQSPYLQDTLFAFVPLKTEAWHTTVHFTLPTELIWQNMGWSDPLLQANFDDGQGWQTLTAGQTYTVEYDSGGVKAIQTRIQQGSTILEAQSIIIVAEQPVQERGEGPNYSETPEDTIAIPGGGGDLRVFYGSPCNKMVKPFIIVEGFELTDNPEIFRRRLEVLLTSEDVITNSSLKLGEWLYAQGYDIVWVNLFDIQGDIQDNAEVVKAAVQKINQIKAANGSSDPNMIMGVSAGGIITKYMLAKTNSVPFDHQCEKFFSYDAPLRGANIPLAVQCLLHHINYIASKNDQDVLGSNPDVAGAFIGLNSPFARQTLLYRFTYENGNEVLSSQEHEDFMAELDALGGIPIRHIALANGSTDNATRTNISEGSHLFNLNTLGTLLTFGWWPLFLPYYIKVELHADGYALSNNPSSLVYDGNFSVIVDGVKVKEYALYVENERDKAYDTAPGGSSTEALVGLDRLNGKTVGDIGIPYLPVIDRWVTMSNLSVTTYASHYCFIPTRSAISAGGGISLNGPFSCGQGSSSRCTMSTEDTPLPAEYKVSTAEKNQDHVFLDARIGDVLVDELDAAHLIPGGLFPSNLSTYYNAGLPVQSGIPTITISTGSGQLSINNTGRVGYSNGNEPVSPSNMFNAYTKCNAVINVENGAKLVVGADGGIKHGILTVTSGSIVHIKSGGILYVTSNTSHLIIKNGATLILDAGAIVRLESPGSSITIQGDLVVNGDITFGGLGYFHFAQGNRLVYGPGYNIFNLTGMGKDKRFVHLSADVLIEDGHRLNWQNGLLEAPSGTLLFTTGAGLDFNSMTLTGGDSGGLTVIEARETGAVNLLDCKVEKLVLPIIGMDGLGCNIGVCEFSQYYVGVTWENAFAVIVSNTSFDGGGASATTALQMKDIFVLFLNYDQFFGHLDPSITGIVTDGDLSLGIPAVNLDNLVACMVKGCTFSNNSIGIKSDNPTTATTANVYAYGATTFSQNEAGIYLVGDNTRGTVLADCVTFDQNRNGIRGRDIALMIDSWNSKTFAFDSDSPNQFIRADGAGPGSTENHVRICYELKGVGGSNMMRNNFWGITAAGAPQPDPTPLNFLFLLNAACNASVPPMPLLTPIATRNIFCPLDQTPASFSTPFPGSECMLSVGSGGAGNPIRVHEQFHLGTFLMKSDSVEAGIEALRPVAALWNTTISSFTGNCQQYIRVAKAFVDASDSNPPNLQRPGGERSKITASGNLLISPNPASNAVLLQLSPAMHQVRIWDGFGNLCHQATASDTYRFETASWQSGIYIVETVAADGSRRSGKLVIQR